MRRICPFVVIRSEWNNFLMTPKRLLIFSTQSIYFFHSEEHFLGYVQDSSSKMHLINLAVHSIHIVVVRAEELRLVDDIGPCHLEYQLQSTVGRKNERSASIVCDGNLHLGDIG